MSLLNKIQSALVIHFMQQVYKLNGARGVGVSERFYWC